MMPNTYIDAEGLGRWTRDVFRDYLASVGVDEATRKEMDEAAMQLGRDVYQVIYPPREPRND